MKKHLKLLVLILSLALIISAVAIVASANEGNVAEVGGKEYATFAEAFAAASNGTVKLIADTTVESMITVTENVTIDLNGYTLKTLSDSGFTVNGDVTFTITGDGEINAAGMLIENTEGKPIVTIEGNPSDIKITAESSVSLLAFKSGVYNLTNVDMVTKISASANVINMPNDSDATLNLKVVSINQKGSDSSQNASVIALGGTAFLNAEQVNIHSDGVVIGLSNGHTGENVLYMKDSVITNVNNTQKNGAVGAWCNVKGLMKFENCLIDSAYRAFCLSCDAKNSPALADLVDTVVRMNGYSTAGEGNMLSRTVPMRMSGSSAVISVSSTSLTYGEYNVQVDEGFRTNLPSLFDPTKIPDNKGFVYPDGTYPSNSETYKFVYDPSGNQEAPYLLVKVGGELDTDYSALMSKASYLWYNNMSKLFANDLDGVLFRNDDDTVDVGCGDATNKLSSTIWSVGNTSHWWHCFGTYESEVVNENQVFKYWVSPGKNGGSTRNFKTAAELPFVEGFNETTAMTPANSKVIVLEVDVATDSALGFPKMTFQPHIRVNSGGGGGNGTAGSGIEIASDGKMTYNKFSETTEYGQTAQLSTTGWNRLSIIIYTDPVSATGTGYYFLNGQLLGVTTNVYNAGTHVFSPRISIGKNQTVGTSLLVDNVMIARYESYQFDGEADGAIDKRCPASYVSKYALGSGITANTIALGNNNYTTVNDALTAGNAIGVAPELNGNVTVPQNVKVNGFISSGSYTIALTDDSYLADVKYNAKEEMLGLDFNEKYSGEIPINWFVGDLNDQDQIYDSNYYVHTTAKLGETPTCDYVYPNIQLTTGDYNQLVHCGFNTTGDGETLETIEPISMHTMNSFKELNFYPVYKEKSVYTWVIVDAVTGEFKRGGTDTTLWNSNWNNNIKLGYGEILVACSDKFAPMGSIKLINKNTGADNKIWGFDLNGHTITSSSLQNSSSIKQASFMTVNEGDTVLLYSSREGGKLIALGADNTTDKIAGCGSIIQVLSGRQVKEENQYSTDVLKTHQYVSENKNANTTVKVGAIDGKYSENLYITADSLIQASAGDASTKVEVDGITFVRNSKDNGFDIVRTEIYYGSISVKNSFIFNPVGGNLVNCSASRTVTDAESGTVYNTDATVSFEGCYYLVKNNGTNAVGDNRGMKEVTFKDFVTNARVNPSHKGVTYGYENVKAAVLALTPANDTVIKAGYNLPMQMPEGITELALTYYTYNVDDANKLIPNTYRFLPYGSEEAEDATVLPLLTAITTTAENTVDVTFKGLGNNEDTVVKYYKGGNVTAPAIADATYNVYKLVHNGSFDKALPEGVQENVTLTPGYEAKTNLNGIKVNLSIYSDFIINLYVPVAYEAYITSITAGKDVISKSTAIIEEVEYIKVTLGRASNEATKDAVFTISLKEGDFTDTVEVSTSIASYAEEILKGESYTAEDKQLMFYMLTYANEAYKYFGDKASYDDKISALLTEYATAKGEGMAEQTYSKAISELALGQVFESATIKLTAAPAFVLTLKDGFAGTVTVTYGQTSRTYTVTADDSRSLVIEGMKVYNFGSELTINASGTVGGAEAKTENAKYNLDTFVKYHVESEAAESVACEALLKALYDYVVCADTSTK